MKYTFHWSDYLVFAFWLLIYSLVGIYQRFRSRLQPLLCRHSCHCAKQEKDPVYIDSRQDLSVSNDQSDVVDTENLFLGGRQLSLFPILASVMASFLSAVSLMGTCSEAYLYGIQFILMIGAYVIGFSVASEVYLPVFYKLRVTSAHEYLEMRFGKAVRSVTSLIFCIQMWIYIALALYAPALAFSQVSGLPLWVTIISTGLVATFYTALGGLRAVVWTDVIQLVILSLGMLLVVILGIIRVGGPERLWEIALSGDRLQSFT
ncbi:putative sodium-dependent multivitamin transporter [Fasciola gigantica]|uniref:Putative sodium-dependent multivitamin transporter n=1 Tax=Fasciola gigantica TaxID=46835 RepID=A0A504YAH2_FASGI|nr:putative sodium-dependent multivitamin transporter [Fasciola gigantica]